MDDQDESEIERKIKQMLGGMSFGIRHRIDDWRTGDLHDVRDPRWNRRIDVRWLISS